MFKDTTPGRNCFCCLMFLIPLIVFSVCICLSPVFPSFGFEMSRLGKSLEFPAIEGRARPYSTLLSTLTQDPVLKEEHETQHVILSMTHPEEYTGIVSVVTTRIYGTSRSFESVQSAFVQFFTANPGWTLETPGDEAKLVTEYGVACVDLSKAPKTDYSDSRAKYLLVYKVEIYYLEPVKTCRLG